jgi:hypothetical protein
LFRVSIPCFVLHALFIFLGLLTGQHHVPQAVDCILDIVHMFFDANLMMIDEHRIYECLSLGRLDGTHVRKYESCYALK